MRLKGKVYVILSVARSYIISVIYVKRLISLITVSLLFFSAIPAVSSAELSVSAESAVLYCPDNGEVYYSENENKSMKPASTTKIMSALLTLEYAQSSNKRVRFSREMMAEGSSMYLKVGEIVRLRDLAVGMLLCSGNDAAKAAAISIDGSEKKFADRMNRRARRIGMKHTHFMTASGLDDDKHYTTAYDMALLMAEAMNNRDFASITAKRSAMVKFVKPSDKRVSYSNHNRLLSSYKYCIGGKTGYTMAAGRCLVSCAEKDGFRLIAVTLNDSDDWRDHAALYDFTFRKYCAAELDDRDFVLKISSADAAAPDIYAACDELSCVVLPKEKSKRVKRVVYADNFLYTPVEDGKVIGRISYMLDNEIVAEHKLYVVNK